MFGPFRGFSIGWVAGNPMLGYNEKTLKNHSKTDLYDYKKMERAKGFEPSTFTLAR
jgi:hypothetical protein